LDDALSKSVPKGTGETVLNWSLGLSLVGLVLILLCGLFLVMLGVLARAHANYVAPSDSAKRIQPLRKALSEGSEYAGWAIGIGIVIAALPGAVFAAMFFGALDLHGWLQKIVNGLDPGTLGSTIATGKVNGALVVVLFALVGAVLERDLSTVVLGGLVGALAVKLSGVLDPALLVGLLIGLVTGVGFGLGFGGAAVLKHLALRYALRRSGVVPARLEPFLEEAKKLVLLRPVGGGYQFLHESLRDYFADQYAPRETRTSDTALAAKA
jgi:hypothetical protein